MFVFIGLNYWIGFGVFELNWEFWVFGFICLLLFGFSLRRDLFMEWCFFIFDFGFFYFIFVGFYIDYVGSFVS